MAFEIVPAHALPLAEQAVVVNAGFAGYVGGWHDFDAEALARFLMAQGADLFLSRFVRNTAGPVGFGYVNRTGRVLRLGGMAVVPEARGSGAAGHLLEALFEEAKARGDEAMTLEVIEQNPRAHALYRRHGFQEVSRLESWRRSDAGTGEIASAEVVEEIPMTQALAWPCAPDYPDLPWPISRHVVAKAVVNTRAFCNSAANVCLVLSESGADAPVRVHALFPGERGNEVQWHEMRALLTAVVARHFPGCELFAPAVFPEKFGAEFFEPFGFARDTLSQFFMRRDF